MGRVIKVFRARHGKYLRRTAVAAALAAAAVVVPAQSAQPDAGQVIALLRQRDYQQALKRADALLTQNPDDCRLLSLRGLALSNLQRPAEADKAFRDSLRSCPENLLALEGAAQIEYAGKKPGAAELLQRILALRPQDVTAHAMLASLERGRGDCRAALPHYEASSAMFAARPQLEQGYAYCLAKTGQLPQAEAAYQTVVGAAPDEAARYNLALVQWQMHDPKSSLETLQPLLASSPNQAVLALGARVAEESGDTPLAVKLLRAAILARPKNLDNYLEFAQISFNHRSFQVGIDMVNAGLTQLPDAAPLYLARGVLEVQLGKRESAVADFEKAHQLQPQLSLAMDAMGIMKSQQFDPTAALGLFREQARQHPKDGLLQYLYAEALSQDTTNADATQEAIAAAQRSIADDPGYGPVRDLLAVLWLRANQPQKALEQAEAALKIQPDDDVALYHEIMARRRLGQSAQVEVLAKKLAVMRAENATKQRASRRYVLQEEPGS